MASPFLSVIIPTRERADTLRYALQSCVAQEYSNAEFIVCNNASTDDTEEVVRSFADPRIRLVNPGTRVSMRENWEFALDHAQGDYVTFIGDDDAMMPHALQKLADLLATQKVDAVKWQTPFYYWPQSDGPNAGRLIVRFGNRVVSVKASAAFNALRWGYLYYTFLPMIYHGAVSRRAIDDIKARSGRFFYSDIPDIYSGIAVSLVVPKYLYLETPLSINGLSRHSTGTAARTAAVAPDKAEANKLVSTFFSENKQGTHSEFVELEALPFSPHSYVTDALLRARDNVRGGRLYIPLWYRLLLIVRELSGLHGTNLRSPTHPLRVYSAKHNMEWLYAIYLSWFVGSKTPGSGPAAENKLVLAINTEEFGVSEVFGASNFLDRLISGVLTMPAGTEVTTPSLLFGRLMAKLARFDAFRLFKLEAFS